MSVAAVNALEGVEYEQLQQAQGAPGGEMAAAGGTGGDLPMDGAGAADGIPFDFGEVVGIPDEAMAAVLRGALVDFNEGVEEAGMPHDELEAPPFSLLHPALNFVALPCPEFRCSALP
jgi:hypothetical protein